MAFDTTSIPPHRVTEVREHANAVMSREMAMQDGDTSRRVDLDGRLPPKAKRSTREVARARGQNISYADGPRANQSGKDKPYLQSICQAHEPGNQLSGLHNPSAFWRCHYMQEHWLCWGFNNVHPSGCRCRKCSEDGGFFQGPPICQRDGYSCTLHHKCNFCVFAGTRTEACRVGNRVTLSDAGAGSSMAWL